MKLITFLILLFLVFPLRAQTWSPPTKIFPEFYRVEIHSITIDHLGNIWFIALQSDRIVARYYDGNQWSRIDTVFSPDWGFWNYSDVDSEGIIWVVCDEYGFTPLVRYYEHNIGWSDVMAIPNAQADIRLTVDSIGRVWVSSTILTRYFEVSSLYYENDRWSEPIPVSTQMNGDCCNFGLTTDRNGTLWSAWVLHHGFADSIYMSTNNGTNWCQPYLGPPSSATTNFHIYGLDLFPTSDGKIWVAWLENTFDDKDSGWRLYSSYRDTIGHWSNPLFIYSESNAKFVEDGINRLWLIHSCSSYVRSLIWDGNGWSMPAIIDTGNAYLASAIYDRYRNRIWVTWFKGDSSYMSYTQINDIAEENPITEFSCPPFDIYPNPAKSVIRVRCPLSEKSIKIFDVLGKIVKEEKVIRLRRTQEHKQEVRISLKGINPGIYFLRLGKETKKLLVVK